MIILEAVLGNIEDGDWKEKLNGANLDYLDLDQWEAQKNRFRKKTGQGVELALSLERNVHLRDGDILCWDSGSKEAIVTRIALQDVFVIDLSELKSLPFEVISQTCFELGHALGNQHWPAVLKENQAYIPLTVDRKVMASVMKTHAFSNISYKFVPGTEVIPYLAPHESRRLFGGASTPPHSPMADSRTGAVSTSFTS